MSTDENKATARRFYEQLDSSGAETVPPEVSPAIIVHQAGAPGPLDLAAFLQFGRAFYHAFPGLRHEIEDQVAEGDRVVTRLTARGTHQHPFQGIPATGRQVAIPAISIQRLADGQIVEQWIELDAMGLMQQLGVMPAPSAV